MNVMAAMRLYSFRWVCIFIFAIAACSRNADEANSSRKRPELLPLAIERRQQLPSKETVLEYAVGPFGSPEQRERSLAGLSVHLGGRVVVVTDSPSSGLPTHITVFRKSQKGYALILQFSSYRFIGVIEVALLGENVVFKCGEFPVAVISKSAFGMSDGDGP